MREIENDCKVLSKVAFLLAIGASMMMLSSCGTIFGVQETDLWGAKFKFYPGTDIHVGANSVNEVEEHRGINVDKYAKR
jgi:hypothetical protein